MDTNRLCPGCMRELTEEEKQNGCPYCGYRLDDNSEGQLHRLKPYTVLNGKYMIGKVLGEGGFGITYLGYDLTLEMKIAIKEYYPTGYVSREIQNSNTVIALTGSGKDFYLSGKEKFIREARTLARFSDLPGIVSVRDYFEANNTSYIIMEYLDGDTLKHYLRKNGGRMQLQAVLQMMQPVIQSLEAVHGQGLIHRDISPDNIMILKNGNLKLLDFGAAREVSGPEAEKSLSVMLKPGYAPEEQYRTHGKQGPWTDLYAICTTIYKCLTGKTPVEAMERMRNDTLEPPSRLGVQMPAWQEAALMKGMALYAEDRYASLTDFYNAFYLNQPSGGNNTNNTSEGGNAAMAGAIIANQAYSARGGSMNQQDNPFGGQPNGTQFDPATGMPTGQVNAQSPFQDQQNTFGTQNTQPGMFGQQAGTGMGFNQNPTTQNGAFGTANTGAPFGGVNNQSGGAFGTQNDPFAMNNQPMNNQMGGQFNMNGNFNGTPYPYGQTPQNNGNKAKLGIILGVIAAIVVAIVGIIVGVVLKGGDDDNGGEVAFVTPTAAPTTTPEPTEEPTATPEPTEEPTDTPEPTEDPDGYDPIPVTPGDGTVMASGTGYTNGQFIVLKNNNWEDNELVYSDTEEWYTILNTDERVQFFQIIGDYIYYTTYDGSSTNEGYSLWRKELSSSSSPEFLLSGVDEFAYHNGLIYFDLWTDYYEFYSYNPSNGDLTKIDNDSVADSMYTWYILNDYVYYECMDDDSVRRMSLDGRDKTTLFYLSEYEITHIRYLTAFDINGVTFLAFNTADNYLYITTEDGSAYELVTDDLSSYDKANRVYFEDGYLFYSMDNGFEIHRMNIAEYLVGDASSIWEVDEIVSHDSYSYFEVNNGLIYIELYGGNQEIKVIDAYTGYEYNEFDFS